MERRSGRTWSDLKPFLPRWSEQRIALVGLTSFGGGVAESGVLVLLTLTADSLIRGSDQVTVIGIDVAQRWAVVIALLLVVVRVAAAVTTAALGARFAAQVMRRAQSKVMTAFLSTAHPARSARPAGDLASVMVTNGRFTGDLASNFATAAAAVCGLLAFGGTSLVVNPLATLAIAVLGALALSAMRPIRRRARATSKAFTGSARDLAAETTEIESLHREIEVFQVSGAVMDRVERDLRNLSSRFVRVRFFSALIPQLFQAILLAAAVLSLLIIVDHVDAAELGAVGAVVLLLIRSMSSAQQLVTTTQRMVEYRPYAESLNELIAEFDTGSVPTGSARPVHLTPLHLNQVSFSYDGSEAVLSDLDLDLGNGELVGVVGASGAGKSTLVELLLRLRQPTQGSIVCGDTPLVDIAPEAFAQRVAFVPQHAVLIRGTVAENVDLFRGLPESAIVDAIRRAHLESEIAALPDGIHTRLGPDDRSLSGGQRQRLTIARSLAGNPEVLILDEPTSALDAVSEHAIREALQEFAVDRLVIVVAHRYSTLRSCSRILALANGRIEADASPDEVAARSAFFRRMMNEGG